MTAPATTTARPAAGPLALALAQGGIEIKQFVRSREALVFTLLFPVILLVIFGAIFDFDIAPGVKFTQYFIAGMIAAGLLAAGFQNLAIQIPGERDRGVLKRLQGTPMPKWVYFAGKVILVLAVGVAEVVLLLTVAMVFYDLPVPPAGHWLTFAWVSVLGITACTLCGIAFSSVARTGRSAPAVVTPVALILQFISGVFFVFTNLPTWMQQIASVFPLKWMCQGMRAVFLPESFAAQEPAGSWELGRVAIVLAAWCVLGLVLCVTTFRWTTKRDG
jgi:ABC-2 type transport system permease protein